MASFSENRFSMKNIWVFVDVSDVGIETEDTGNDNICEGD